MYVRVSYHLVGSNEHQTSWSKLQSKPGKEVSMLKTSIASRESAPCTYFPSVEAQNEPHPMGIGTNPTCRCTKRHRPMGPPSAFISHMAMLEMSLVPRESGTCTYFPSVDAKNEQSVHNNCDLFSKRINLLIEIIHWIYSMSKFILFEDNCRFLVLKVKIKAPPLLYSDYQNLVVL